MRDTRTNEEHLIDQLLMLKLLDAMEQHSRCEDGFQEIMNVMKAAFAAAWKMLERRIKGLNMVFFTYTHGPFSIDLYAVRDSLLDAGLIEQRPETHYEYRLTPKGRKILEGCRELLESPPNQRIVSIVEDAGRQIAPLTSLQARARSHRIKVIPASEKNLFTRPARPGDSGAINLGELPWYENLTQVFDKGEAEECFEMDEDWYDTLEILFSPDYDPEAMRQASDKTYEELFAGV